jgi:hypothetical protein
MAYRYKDEVYRALIFGHVANVVKANAPYCGSKIFLAGRVILAVFALVGFIGLLGG